MAEPAPINEECDSVGADVHTDGSWTQTPKKEEGHPSPSTILDVLERTQSIGLLEDYLVEVVLAVCISKELETRNPIWLMLVGSPSCNKTVMVSLLRSSPETFWLDTMTSNPFISGMHKKDNPQDLLPTLDGTCFIVKDYTPFFGRSEETVKQLLSDLVSIYDGEYSKHSGARGTVRYKAVFSHIGCVTPMGLNMRQQYMNMVGARFLTIRVPELTETQREECFGIAWAEDLKERIKAASEVASALVNSICNSIRTYGVQLSPVPPEIQKELNLLATLVSRARGEVKMKTRTFVTDEGQEQTYQEAEEVQMEEPFRALHQLKALCRSLAILRGKEEVTEAEVLTVRRVALSSMPVQRAEVLSAYRAEPRLSAKEISTILDRNYKTVKRHLDELVYLKVLRKEKGADGKTWLYTPEPRFESLILSHNFPDALD